MWDAKKDEVERLLWNVYWGRGCEATSLRPPDGNIPATGVVRVKGVTNAPNAVLHPWLQAELTDIFAALLPSPPPPLPTDHPLRQQWERWGSWLAGASLPPLRLILVWDNLVGYTSAVLLRWFAGHGGLPLYTPLSGSWLNMAESVQRIIVRRALAGQDPATSDDLIGWLEETAAGWNEEPTPFVWDGRRRERRRRARAHPWAGVLLSSINST